MISKKVRELFVSLMEATNNNNTSQVRYDPRTDNYRGSFNLTLLNKFIDEGVFEVVSNDADGIEILMNNRDDFLSSFASGVKEAKLGRDQYYADYNANPFAFSVGYEHFMHMNKKPKKLEGYACYGFE
ncbi:hypothetical protein [Paraglaciecola arctica]|uniref:hypothetical protein n=1 Tax=Paraglaciecola arctica TaxID=1128911 RepID=UPI001C06FDDC|nr:hypothetical protein [Paraglaciecola arctica]MBU3002006.1 hypothetical protein [Paraglaciecola arctica]